jgi:hypothetical protein
MKIIGLLQKMVLIFIFALLLTSCATILGGRNNTLNFNEESLPVAEIYIDGEKVGEAPGKIKLPKRKIQHGSKLLIQADGYDSQEYVLLRKPHGVYTAVDLILGGIPLIVDYTSGNIYRPKPRKFHYELEKQN